MVSREAGHGLPALRNRSRHEASGKQRNLMARERKKRGPRA